MLESLRQLIAAPACLLCRGRTSSLLCECCLGDLPWNRVSCPSCALPLSASAPHLCRRCARRAPPFSAALTAFRYAAPVDRAVHQLKYSADFLAAQWLSDCLAQSVMLAGHDLPDVLLPVPLHRSRLRIRGYNQAHEIARRVAVRLRIPCEPHAARRVRATEDQIGKSAAQRRRNLRGAFAVLEPLHGRRVALIDDVMTTGSTLAELSRACLHAGASSVAVWCVARVE